MYLKKNQQLLSIAALVQVLVLDTTQLPVLRVTVKQCRELVKSTDRSCRRPEFIPRGPSQASVTPVPGKPCLLQTFVDSRHTHLYA